ncbi:MAG TPA: cobaltochelatase subunit CobN, partial [Pedobacter sp.]
FHSINSDWQVTAIFDYIDSMVAADGFQVPPAELNEFVFQFYTWKGTEAPVSDQFNHPKEKNGIVFLTHADTDLLTLHRALQFLSKDFPQTLGINLAAVKSEAHMAQLLDREIAAAKIIVLRILGRPSSIPGFSELVQRVQKQGQHLIIVSGTSDFNPEYAAVSTVSPDILQETLNYLDAGGHMNVVSLLHYLSDRLLMTGFGYEAPVILPQHGIYHPDLPENATIEDWEQKRNPSFADVGITFYRAHYISGNTVFIDALIRSLEDRNLNVLPIFTASLKATDPVSGWPLALQFFKAEGRTSRIGVLINTVSFAMQDGNSPAPGGNILSKLDVPVLQAITSGMARGSWESSGRGLNPLDTAMNVAIPEFDGRIITVPISFKEKGREAKGYEALEDRIERVAGIAARFARLRHLPNHSKKIAFVFTNSSSKASQIGNAVGLDAPESLMAILHAMEAEGYQIPELPVSGTQLIHDLISRCSYDETYLTTEQLANAVGQVSFERYTEWFKELPVALQQKMEKQWGAAPGETYIHDNHIAFAGMDLGNVMVALQPPRGYGMDPDAIYHQPDLPPTHHYHAFYKWLRNDWGADAIVHVGKHGTLEWLPGKGIGLSENCFPDAFLEDMPLFYPFIINDPGEGSQAKRRAHAVVVDHLTPAMTSADSYGELALLTQLVDEYYQVETLDPSKLPLLQQEIWNLIKRTNLDKDLSVMLKRDHGDHVHEWDDEMTPEGVPVSIAEMDGKDVAHLIEDIDGYLCELGAAQIRNGLHILGQAPEGTALIDMLQSLTRLSNIGVPSLSFEIAALFGFDQHELLDEKGKRLRGAVPSDFISLAGRHVVTAADALEIIDELGNHLLQVLNKYHFNKELVHQAFFETFNRAVSGADDQPRHKAAKQIIKV